MPDKYISSISNPIIKNLVLLQNKKSARKEQQLYIVEGTRAVKDLDKSAEISYYVSTEPIETDIDVIIVPENVFMHISDTKSPQGIMAVVKQNHIEPSQMATSGLYLILENIQDPGNMGTIIRTAYGMGVDTIVLTKGCVDLYSPKVVRSTMGAITKMQIAIEADIQSCLSFFEKTDVKVFATDLANSTDIYKNNFLGDVALIIGNEANGISDLVRTSVQNKVSIPMPGGLESLNASIATGICLYEIMKQRRGE